MIELVMCTLFYILLVVFELIQIYRSKNKKLFWIYSIILIITYIIHILFIIGVKVPTPAEPIKNIISKIFKLNT